MAISISRGSRALPESGATERAGSNGRAGANGTDAS
jgi:hypothetical protein